MGLSRRGLPAALSTSDGIPVLVPVELSEGGATHHRSTSLQRLGPPSSFAQGALIRHDPHIAPHGYHMASHANYHMASHANSHANSHAHSHAHTRGGGAKKHGVTQEERVITYEHHYDVRGGDKDITHVVTDTRRAQHDDLRRAHDALKLENESLSMRLKDALKSGSSFGAGKDRVAELETIRVGLIHQLETLNVENESLARQFDEARRTWESRKHSDEEVAALKAKLTELEMSREEVRTRYESRESEMETRCRRLEADMSALREELQRSLDSNQRLTLELEAARRNSVTVERERELLHQIEVLTRDSKAEQRRLELMLREAEQDRDGMVPVEREMELLEQTEHITTALGAKERLIDELRRDNRDLGAQRASCIAFCYLC